MAVDLKSDLFFITCVIQKCWYLQHRYKFEATYIDEINSLMLC